MGAIHSEDGFFDNMIVFPVVANKLMQLNTTNYAEFGLGGVIVASNDQKPTFYFSPSIGLRNQNMLKSGFVGRVSVLPYFDKKFRFWPGASVGYGF